MLKLAKRSSMANENERDTTSRLSLLGDAWKMLIK